MDLGIPLSSLLRLGAHLVDWGLGIIIEPLTKHSVYAINPDADVAVNSRQAREFRMFASEYLELEWSLPLLLERFTIPCELDAHMRAQVDGPEFKACLLWLLRSNILIQLRTFIYLTLPEGESSSERYLRRRQLDHDEFERMLRIFGYFDGEHHIEDIMWREGISRSELETILANYADVLTTVMY